MTEAGAVFVREGRAILCLAWLPDAPHPGLPLFVKQARRDAYAR